METLVSILVVDPEQKFVGGIEELMNHPQVSVDCADSVPDDKEYDFYILSENNRIIEALDIIRTKFGNAPVYLAGGACHAKVPIQSLVKITIVGCLQDKEGLVEFIQHVTSSCKQQIKLQQASTKLDCLKSGDYRSLAKHMSKTGSEQFVDYIQNHPLPMLLVSREGEVLHANIAMENLIGMKLSGLDAFTFWADVQEFNDALLELKKKGQILGRKIVLKDIHGSSIGVKLYTSLHSDNHGVWLNTRCLFVPLD